MPRKINSNSEGLRKKHLFTGQRVYIHLPSEADEQEFLKVVRVSRSLHRPWVSPPSTRAAYRQYLQRNEGDDFKSVLVRRTEGELVGIFNLSQIFRGGFQNAYLGYWASAAFARQGYMSEGLRLVLEFAFRKLKLHRLEANIQPDNVASKTLVESCGFRYEGFSPRYLKVFGRWRDHERWAICREEWTESSNPH